MKKTLAALLTTAAMLIPSPTTEKELLAPQSYNEHQERKSAVMIVDVQDHFYRNIRPAEREKEIPNMLRVLDYADKNRLPVFVIEYDHSEFAFIGPTISILKERLDTLQDPPIYVTKQEDDAFCSWKIEQGTRRIHADFDCPDLLERELRKEEISDILLMGYKASECVKATAQSAYNLGYNIWTSPQLIADPHYSFKDESAHWYATHGKFTNFEDLLDNLP